jgi:hypothetical protein
LDGRVHSIARGTFVIEMRPGPPELDGAVSRFDFTKTFDGDLEGTGAGLMLAGGDPGSGSAGYVAVETVSGRLAGRDGGFALQQLGMMSGGEQTLHYQVAPGSGTGELAGMTGTLELTVEEDGTHRYELAYELPGS